jgi:hypothetical protein
MLEKHHPHNQTIMAPSSSTTPPTSGSLHSNLPPTFVSGKAALAPAEVDNEQVELRDMVSSGPTSEMALKDDIMKLAMHGDELAVRALLDSGTVSACYQDSDGLTPLHVWEFPFLLIYTIRIGRRSRCADRSVRSVCRLRGGENSGQRSIIDTV